MRVFILLTLRRSVRIADRVIVNLQAHFYRRVHLNIVLIPVAVEPFLFLQLCLGIDRCINTFNLCIDPSFVAIIVARIDECPARVRSLNARLFVCTRFS